MTPTRKLSLKREALHELNSDELAGVAGGATWFSCYTFVSCNPLHCVVTRPSLADCIVSLPRDCVYTVTC